MVWAAVEDGLYRTRQKLTMPDFEIIKGSMDGIYKDQRVKVGERLTSRNPNVVKRALKERKHPQRSANALHSYVTKTAQYGDRYEQLCRRILENTTEYIPGEVEDEELRDEEDVRAEEIARAEEAARAEENGGGNGGDHK